MTSLSRELPVRPRIRASYHVIPMSDNRIQLRSGADAFILRGETVQALMQALLPLLTGEHSVAYILEKLDGTHAPESIRNLLQTLSARRVIEDAAVMPPESVSKEEMDGYRPQLTYFSHYAANPYEQQARLRQARVAVCGLGPLGARVAASLTRAGVGEIVGLDDRPVKQEDFQQGLLFAPEDLGRLRAEVFSTPAQSNQMVRRQGVAEPIRGPEYFVRHLEGVDYLVVCLETPRPRLLQWVNQACLEHRLTWTWCALDGHEGTVGPTVIPHQLACWKCYDLRVKSNVDHYEEYLALDNYLHQADPAEAGFGYLVPSLDLLAGLTALEIVKDLSGLTPPLTYGAQLSVNLLTSEFDLHPVLKLPRCPVCGRADEQGAMVRPFLEKA